MQEVPAEPWVKQKLDQRLVFPEGDKWRFNCYGMKIGSCDSQAEALKAFRQAAIEHFKEGARVPSEADIDAVLGVEPPPAAPKVRTRRRA